MEQTIYVPGPARPNVTRILNSKDIMRYRGAQIAYHELWDDTHISLVKQTKEYSLYSAKIARRMKNDYATLRMSLYT